MKSETLHITKRTFCTLATAVLLSVAAKAQYCAPPGTVLVSDDVINYLTNVTIQGTTFNSSTITVPANGYYLAPTTPSSNTASLVPGTTYSVSFTYDPNDVVGIGMWIDYNQNTTFDQPEFVPVPLNASGNTITSFTVPASAASGQTRMRVMISEELNIAANHSCSDLDDGEVEDYTLTILGSNPPTCAPPIGLAALNVTSTEADLKWNTVPGAVGYEYTVNQSSTVPVTPGTSSVDTNGSINLLLPATTYFLHVRAQCDSVTFSNWNSQSFTTAATTGVGSVDNEEPALRLYPNPASDHVMIEAPGTAEIEYAVTSIAGKLVKAGSLKAGAPYISVGDLTAGMYTVSLRTGPVSKQFNDYEITLLCLI